MNVHDTFWPIFRLACRLGWHNQTCRGRSDHL